MKGICFQSIEKIGLMELDEPQIENPTDAIVKVSMAGLCGSDLHPFHGREVGLDVGTVMGHEMVGTVVEIGDEVSGVEVGDQVFTPFSTSCGVCFYCRRGLTSRCVDAQLFGWVENKAGLHGCQSEWVRVPNASGTLVKMPEGLSSEAALLLGDNLSTGYYCAEMAGAGDCEVVVVVGCGTVGLLAICAARMLGAEKVVAVDPVTSRRQQAEAMGATAVTPDEALGVVTGLTAGRGADAVMELVGNLPAQKQAFDLLRPGGVLSVIGCHCTPDFSFSPVDAYDKNLTYRTGRCPARHYMDRLTSDVLSGNFDTDSFRIEDMITHRFGPGDCVEAYDVFAHRKDNCVKAVIEFD